MSKIIILRGNSASGKSTVAKTLQNKLGHGTLLLSQDYIRREMIYVSDKPDNMAVHLLKNLAMFGYENCEHIILEGILYADIYADLFAVIKQLFGTQIFAYYFDIPFEETLKRHEQRAKSQEFGEEEMRKWWREKDYLPFIKEKILHEDLCVEEILWQIFADING